MTCPSRFKYKLTDLPDFFLTVWVKSHHKIRSSRLSHRMRLTQKLLQLKSAIWCRMSVSFLIWKYKKGANKHTLCYNKPSEKCILPNFLVRDESMSWCFFYIKMRIQNINFVFLVEVIKMYIIDSPQTKYNK